MGARRDGSVPHDRYAFFHKQSAHRFTERGVELDGQVVREYPAPRRFELPVVGPTVGSGA